MRFIELRKFRDGCFPVIQCIQCEAIQLQRRSLESKVRQEEAAARLAELNTLDKELDLLKKRQETGTILHRDENGNLTVLPIAADCDLMNLAYQLQKQKLLDLPSDAESKS